MENKNNEMNFAAPENEKNIAAVETAELEFLPADTVVPDADTDKGSAKDERKEDEVSVPAPEEVETEDTSAEEDDSDMDDGEQNSPAYLLKLVLVLTLICTCIALLLAVVNNITKDKIAENVANQMQEAILAIFPDGTETEEYVTDSGETAYIVYRDGEVIGYCVNTAGSGFGGNVELMVGINSLGEVHGLKIVSMSETPGIGTKVQSDAFLGQFIGQKGSAEADMISGATFSSNAVKEAVDRALAIEIDLAAIGQADNTSEQ